MLWLKTQHTKRRAYKIVLAFFFIIVFAEFMLQTLPHMFLKHTFLLLKSLEAQKADWVDDKLRLILENVENFPSLLSSAAMD